MEWLIIFGSVTSFLIGYVGLMEDVYGYWYQCNVLGKIGLILIMVLGIVGTIIVGAVFLIAIIGSINLKKYLIKKEYRG